MLRSIIHVAALLAATAVQAQTIDAFNPDPNGEPTSVATQADGKVIIVGAFLDMGSTARSRVARLNMDGSVDTSFADPDVDSVVNTVAIQADGKLLIGGSFSTVAGQPRHSLARLNADGSLDASFADPDLDDTVWALAIQSDGRVLAAGDFGHIGSVAQSYIARFTTAGALDASFVDPHLCCLPARAVALQADGHVLVGGYFSQVGDASHFYFARFSSSGAFDPSFPNVGRNVQAGSIVVAPDGSVYVGELGSEIVLKLSAGGTPVAGFTSAVADSTINSLALQPDGKLLIGGIFQLIGNQPRHALARLNADGSLDPSFGDLHFSLDAAQPNGYIDGIAAQADGRIIAVGNFSLVGSQSRQFAARVVTGDYATSALVVQGGSGNVTATWFRLGDGSELAAAPILEHSTDGINFTAFGAMVRVGNGWRVTAPYNVSGPRFYLRAVGTTSTGGRNGTLGQIASEIYSSDTVFHGDFE